VCFAIRAFIPYSRWREFVVVGASRPAQFIGGAMTVANNGERNQ
jgi:hypothetical protein